MSVTITKPEINLREDILFKVQSAYIQAPDVSPVDGSTYTFDFALGDSQKVTAPSGGSITIAFTGFITGKLSVVYIDAVNWGDATITFPTGLLFSGKALPKFTSAGMDKIMLIKDGADIYSLFIVGTDVGVL